MALKRIVKMSSDLDTSIKTLCYNGAQTYCVLALKRIVNALKRNSPVLRVPNAINSSSLTRSLNGSVDRALNSSFENIEVHNFAL